jgi:hypothetical protein
MKAGCSPDDIFFGCIPERKGSLCSNKGQPCVNCHRLNPIGKKKIPIPCPAGDGCHWFLSVAIFPISGYFSLLYQIPEDEVHL